MTRWSVVHGEILDLTADGLICSANPNLNLSGGVGGAFALRYGEEMQTFLHDHLRESGKPFLAPGEVVLSPPCGSPYRAVVHAVAIDGFYDTDAETLLSTYRAAIARLTEAGCASIAAACLGCGYGRFPEAEFVSVAETLQKLTFKELDMVCLCTTNEPLATSLKQTLAKPS